MLFVNAIPLKCWVNGNGKDGTAPFKSNVTLAADYCVHEHYNGYEYYTASNNSQVQVIIQQHKNAPYGYGIGLFYCATDYCNSPDVKLEITNTLPTSSVVATVPTSPNGALGDSFLVSLLGALVVF